MTEKRTGAIAIDRRRSAAHMTAETMRVLAKSGSNVVAEVLATVPEFVEWEHVPGTDVIDEHAGAQYFYHAHAKSPDGTGPHDDEHGHFHLFLTGVALKGLLPDPLPPEATCHLVGIGMNRHGVPIRLFTTNAWVTGEAFLAAERVIPRIDRFEIDLTRPSWPLNLWISSMATMFGPQIAALLQQRDQRIAAWSAANPDTDPLEDRALEITSSLPIDLDKAVLALIDPSPRSRTVAG